MKILDKLNEERKYCVYIHTSPSRKVYIGITRTDPKKRWGKNGSGYKKQQYFWRAIQKYGWDNFKHEILYEHLTKEEAEGLEIQLIAEYRSNQKEFGYNIENGGSSTGKISDETRKKISEANMGRQSPNKGKPMSEEQKRKISIAKMGHSNGPQPEETKRKISEANTGKIVSEETRKKLSDIRKECWQNEDYRLNQVEKHKWQAGEDHPFYGRHHTEDTKEKISQKAKERFANDTDHPFHNKRDLSAENNPFYGKTHSEETKQKISKANSGANNGHARKVIQYDKGGNVIKTWECIMDASIVLNINYCSIIACCNGRQKTAGGFIWKYAIDEVEDILCA